MNAGLVAAAVFVVLVIVLAVYLRREDAKGTWSKEGHGRDEDREPGVRFRPLQSPAKPPFGPGRKPRKDR